MSARAVPPVLHDPDTDAGAAGPVRRQDADSADEPPVSAFTPVADDAAQRPRGEHPDRSAPGYSARGDELPELPDASPRAVQGQDERQSERDPYRRHERTPSPVPPRGAYDQAAPPRADHGPGFGAGPAGPRLAADGSWTWGPASLTRDQVRVAEDAYDRFRAAEGRNLFGGYDGGNGLTTTMRRVEEQLARGRLAPDTEERALLEPDVFRARLADMLRRHPDRTPEQLGRRVPGALSYVFILEPEHYADGIRVIQEALETQGLQLQARKNSWSSAVNRCVFTIWHDPLNDLPFQVQFHTEASLEAQHLARSSATLINDPRIAPAEAARLHSELTSAWAALPVPPGNTEIADYRRAGDAARR
ncbi:MAG TPA: hypothetical protein VEM58_15965 [Streptosporangiaceae bacterium]|nr:hypothetical protein [Streptosporangiaceae bacterium]